MYIEEINNLLREKSGYSPKKTGNGFSAHCPAHDDSNPSLSISEGNDGRILVHCHAGCSPEQICAALKIEMNALFRERIQAREESTEITINYTYEDEFGKPLYRKTRIEPGKNGKKKDFFMSTFRQEENTWIKGLDTDRRVLYRLPKVIDAIARREIIFLVEGEKNAEDLLLHGLKATTSIESAGAKWKEEYTEQLKGARVALLYDEDHAGYKRRDEIMQALPGHVASLQVIKLPGLEFREDHGLDISDWLKLGNTPNDLLDLVSAEERKREEAKIKVVNINEFLSMSLPERQMILKPHKTRDNPCPEAVLKAQCRYLQYLYLYEIFQIYGRQSSLRLEI
jgi:putative DNA primase/helicase